MAKLDPVVFRKMMNELNAADDRTGPIVRSPLEELEPDIEYLPAADRRGLD